MKTGTAEERGAVYIASRVFLDAGTLLSPGAVAVSGGTVIAAGSPGEVGRELPAGFRRCECPGAAILPGLVNAHTHLQIPRMKIRESGAPVSSLPFVDWILAIIAWRDGAPRGEFLDNFRAAAAESLSFGTTAAGEIARPDPGVYGDGSLRARLFSEGIGFSGPAAPDALASVEAGLARIEESSRSTGMRVVPGVSPHTLYTVGPELLGLLGDLARRRGIPACLHLAESTAEMEFLSTGGGEIASRLYPSVGRDVSWFHGIGMPIPAYLRKTGLLREGLLLAHNVHLTRRDIDVLAGEGARFVLCPRSNAAHGNGSPDVTHFVDAGIPFALGTDSLGSVPDLSLWEEMRAARALYRGRLKEEELCRALFRAGTENGSAALSLAGGALRPGAPADFTVTDDMGGRGAAASVRNLVDRSGGAGVRMTVVGGERLWERA